MFIHPQFDPIAIHLGPLAIRWYGLMYLGGFLALLFLGKRKIKTNPELGFTDQDLDNLLFYGILGVILGGRLGYVLFYQFDHFLAHPTDMFKLWEGGMSFHGGFLGVMASMMFFAKQKACKWQQVTDFIIPFVPIGLGLGRIGNFINAELWGRPTDLPIGMIFQNVDYHPRHPSQLYEFVLEGIVLFTILYLYSRKPRPIGSVSALFLIWYGIFRFIVEFTREPDSFLGLLWLGLSMGQWLSLPMVILGVALWYYSTLYHQDKAKF